MLVLTRKPRQQIMIGDDVVVHVVEVQGDNVRIVHTAHAAHTSYTRPDANTYPHPGAYAKTFTRKENLEHHAEQLLKGNQRRSVVPHHSHDQSGRCDQQVPLLAQQR